MTNDSLATILSGYVTLLINYGYFSNLCTDFWMGLYWCQYLSEDVHYIMGLYLHNFY